MEKLLTIEEAATILGVAKKTLYMYVSAKKIPYCKVGSLVRFKETDLEAWVSAREVRPIGEGRT